MKFLPNILKAFLVNFFLIGIIFASEVCPSISPKIAGDSPKDQVEAILNGIVCSFIELQSDNSENSSSTLNLTKKKILPYVDLQYFTELALKDYWDQLDLRERKIFERDIKNSLIEEYIDILSGFKDWKDVQISVDEDFTQKDNIANIKVSVSLQNQNTTVTLKLIRKKRWKIYDLDYQTLSIVGIEKIGYDSKIKRQGIEKLIQKMLKKS
tara:strand:+ start:50 stop:682 length:633 start_codon:yes stop_codon:yes gene_type:complete